MSTIQDRIEIALMTRWEIGKITTIIGPRGGRIVIGKNGNIYRCGKAKHHTKKIKN